MREINMELIRVTEAAAIAGAQWVGSGDKLSADKAATEAMRERFNHVPFRGRIMIGEGKKDKSFGLFYGDEVGALQGNKDAAVWELAVDPIDGTRPTVTAGPEAISVIAAASEGALFTTEAHYMNKLAWGPAIQRRAKLSIADPIEQTIKAVSAALEKPSSKITVCILDRPRHEDLIKRVRAMGVRIKLIQDCDVSGAIATCLDESGIDLLCGVGGAPEAVITACAMKCLRGGFQCQIADDTGKVSSAEILGIDGLVKSHCTFIATGVTNGSLLKGVRYTGQGPVTHSLFMRSESGTVRWIETWHGRQQVS